jgi:hypothetical protein
MNDTQNKLKKEIKIEKIDDTEKGLINCAMPTLMDIPVIKNNSKFLESIFPYSLTIKKSDDSGEVYLSMELRPSHLIDYVGTKFNSEEVRNSGIISMVIGEKGQIDKGNLNLFFEDFDKMIDEINQSHVNIDNNPYLPLLAITPTISALTEPIIGYRQFLKGAVDVAIMSQNQGIITLNDEKRKSFEKPVKLEDLFTYVRYKETNNFKAIPEGWQIYKQIQ